VVEEAPSPLLTLPEHSALRARLTRAALAVAAAVQYTNAGTVEFLVDEALGWYFIEMNTRLQVEHPVTECVTGIDLVAEQIRLAEGAPLAWRQEDVVLRGAALECRIYAENPARNFLPSPGHITAVHFPTGPGVRIDSGIAAGTRVTPYYDPLLAKVITSGENRAQAISRMRQTLTDLVIDGIVSNIALHQHIMDNASFQAATLTTDFLSSTFYSQ
jgi:acetyl/propionyl-CoA carboxylase alpha subunit